jgi:putative transposase
LRSLCWCGSVGAEQPLRRFGRLRRPSSRAVHGLLLDRHASGVRRSHDSRIAVDKRNRRWSSDGFEIGCDDGGEVEVVTLPAIPAASLATSVSGREQHPSRVPRATEWAEALRTIKRDYVHVSPRPNAETVMRQLPSWIAHYSEGPLYKTLGYRSPREFIEAHERT